MPSSRRACGGANATVLNRCGAAGVNARPTVPDKPRSQPRALPHRNPCRGRFHIGPVCGGAGLHGRIWNPPLQTAASACDQTGSRNSRVSVTPVGDDARIVPGALRQGRVCGRAMALPYKPWQTPGPARKAAALRANVGRDAPSRRALRRHERHGFESCGAAGVNARPTVPGEPRGHPQTLRCRKVPRVG